MKWFELKLYITNYLHLGLLVVKDITDEKLISLIEWKNRLYMPLCGTSTCSHNVKETLETWLSIFRNKVELGLLYKTITADNGLEFADITDLEDEILSILQGFIQLVNEALTKDITVYIVNLFRNENV